MIAAVLLAAGSARRFDGRQKLLAAVPHEGGEIPLVRAAALGLLDAGVGRVVVVVGRDAEKVRESLNGVAVRFIMNSDFATGMASSLRVGVAEATRLWPESAWILIALGDQPLRGQGVVETLVRTVVSAPTAPARQIIAPRFQGEPGNPVVFANMLVPELMAISGDRGARSVVERLPARVQYIDFACSAPPDIDTLADLERLRGRTA